MWRQKMETLRIGMMKGKLLAKDIEKSGTTWEQQKEKWKLFLIWRSEKLSLSSGRIRRDFTSI